MILECAAPWKGVDANQLSMTMIQWTQELDLVGRRWTDSRRILGASLVQHPEDRDGEDKANRDSPAESLHSP
jgi:hypothetical protein